MQQSWHVALAVRKSISDSKNFIDTDHIYFTTPVFTGTSGNWNLQLGKAIEKAKSRAKGVIVVYGGKYCYSIGMNPPG